MVILENNGNAKKRNFVGVCTQCNSKLLIGEGELIYDVQFEDRSKPQLVGYKILECPCCGAVQPYVTIKKD